MKKQILTLMLAVSFVTNIAFAMDEDPNESFYKRQREWSSLHIPAEEIFQSANPSVTPLQEFSKLHVNTLPHPDVYHFYLRDQAGAMCHLVKDPSTQTMKMVRFFGTPGEDKPSYVTIGHPSSVLPKESFVSPPPALFKGAAQYPTSKSTSYPTGLCTYYIIVNGKKIRFDRGHGIPHVDTLQHKGLTSTKDAENYVPQNIKYNSPIRRDLEADLRGKGLQYKEIAIYHSNCLYEATISKAKTKFTIPAPEGFLLMTYNENGEVSDSYYFPNFVDYELLKGNKPNYKDFPKLYRIPNLSDWFFNPEVTLGSLDDHQNKVHKARLLGHKILLFSPTFFSQFSEDQMPPKARAALLTTLLEWNVETSATLEFLSFENQLHLAHFYLTSRRNFWELDDRYEAEKAASLEAFLKDERVSPPARELVLFLKKDSSFASLQYELQQFIAEFEEVYRNAPYYWARPDVSSFFPIITTFTSIKTGEQHKCVISKILPTDIQKLKTLIGGPSKHSLLKAQHILSIIDERARKTPSSIMDKLGMMRLYHDNEGLEAPEKHLYWEKAILDQITNGKDVTLLDRRMVADYYSYRRMKTEKAFWLDQFVSYVQNNPTPENFFLIANWCRDSRAAFLQDLQEQVETTAASNTLALQIYKCLSFCYPVYREKCVEPLHSLQQKLGLYENDPLKIIKADILAPFLLEPFLKKGPTGGKLRRLYYILLSQLPRPPHNLKNILEKNTDDFKHNATFYNKLGMQKEAQDYAGQCLLAAKNISDYKKATITLCKVGLEHQALPAAELSLILAGTTNNHSDYMHVFKASHKLGVQILKQKTTAVGFRADFLADLGAQALALKQKAQILCLSTVKDPSDFVTIAITFYKLGLYDDAREAASMNYECAQTSEDLNWAVRIFKQHDVTELAIEAANRSFEIAKSPADFDCVTKNFKLLGLPIPQR